MTGDDIADSLNAENIDVTDPENQTQEDTPGEQSVSIENMDVVNLGLDLRKIVVPSQEVMTG